ncbi:MAG: AAA family ATPase [Candidatus Eremiobacteraeota bacterium]|nr:AAA family ATPase [Candidatus Eremiobacteraeota bacterium]MCW5867558.1 AAA family ATPase [Candidatus Eremiobacteraeota bacterium]
MINPTPGSIKAQEGLKAMPRGSGVSQQAKTGDTFVASIAQETTEPVERELCRVVQETGGKVVSDAGKAALSRAALNLLAQGVTGSLGGLLAGLGLEVMDKANATPQQDQVQVGQKLLSEIAAATENDGEKVLSGMAQTTLNRLDTNASKVAVAQSMLQAIHTGLAVSMGGMLAGVGVRAMAGVGEAQLKNQAVAGAQFLQNIAEKGSPEEQELSRVAIHAFTAADSHGARSAVASAALSVLALGETSSPGLKLAQMGFQAVSQTDLAEVKNRCSVGLSFLDGVADHSGPDSSEGVMARVAMAACEGMDDYGARAAVAQATLAGLVQGDELSLDQRLAQAGATALTGIAAGQPVNRANAAAAFVTAVSEHSSDEARRGSAREALQKASESSTYDAKAQVLSEFLSQSAPGLASVEAETKPVDAKATETPAAAEKPKLDEASAAELKKVKDNVTGQVEPDWARRLDEEVAKGLEAGKLPDPKELSGQLFAQSWSDWEGKIAGAVKENEKVSALTAEQQAEQLGEEAMKKWAESTPAPLTFGETFVARTVEPGQLSGADDKDREARTRVINNMAKAQLPADGRDTELLRQVLDVLPTAVLTDLEKSKYTVTVTRDRVSNAHAKLEGKMENGALTDMNEGALILEDKQNPRILVRSHWKRGQLEIDPATLLREIGRAYDRSGQLTKYLADSFKNEVAGVPKQYQANAADFTAEMFVRYNMDPERCGRQFPLATAAFEKAGWNKQKFNLKAMADLQQSHDPVVNISPDPYQELRTLEELNKVQKAKGVPVLPYRFEIQGDANHNVGELIDRLGEVLREARSPGLPKYSPGEGAVRIPAATFNNPADLEKFLNEQVQSGRGTFLVLDELGSLQADSPGFATLSKYVERFGGQTPLLLQGSGSDLNRLREALPTAVQKRFTTSPLTAGMITELVSQNAASEGYDLSSEAKQALAGKAKDGELGQMFALWNGVKTSQTDRTTELLPFLKANPIGVRRVLTSDVKNAKMSREKDPLEEMERLVGLGNAKKELRAVLAQVKLQKQQEEFGMTAERPRLNLLFEGNPGTGKTTVAKLFSDALTRVGYLKNNKFKEVRVQDLITGRKPEENVKKLFEENKGGVIFLDEMHQLKDSPEGRLAFRAMIPYLGHPEYADTVFIGAGYKGEMRDLIRDVDDGAERRFTSVPFDDYSKEELGKILDKMAVDKQRVIDEPTREAALMRLERERRKMKNFGNAGSVASMIEIAIKKQTARLSEGEVELTREALMGLIPEDFAAERVLTPEEVWKEIDALEGLDTLKRELRTICASIEYDREMGNDPLDSFEPYFILDGPPGTGKTTMARLIVKLMAAYDIIPSAGLAESQGADLQAGFIGQTTTKVQKLFESMWGQGGFIDEIGGLARAPEAFQADAAKTMLKQMEDHRGRFILVVADYADRVNEFLNVDPGIARRFGHRFSLEPLSVEGGVRSLCKQLGAKELTLTEEVTTLIGARMNDLHAAPDWASSGDVRKVLNSIVTKQKTAFMNARKAGRQVDPKELLPEAVNAGFDSLIKEKNAKGPQKKSFADEMREFFNNRR